jgi:hypothetical protein
MSYVFCQKYKYKKEYKNTLYPYKVFYTFESFMLQVFLLRSKCPPRNFTNGTSKCFVGSECVQVVFKIAKLIKEYKKHYHMHH